MSKIFYDNILDLGEVEKLVKKVSTSHDEEIELWDIVDGIVHHKVMNCILETLPKKYHQEFINIFKNSPHDEKIIDYLKEKTKKDVVVVIKESIALLALELSKKMKS